MRIQTGLLFILPLFTSCQEPAPINKSHPATAQPSANINPYAAIGDIPLPVGYHRMTIDKNSFGAWLRKFPLKKDKTVYLYDGRLKDDQTVQFAVLNISTGHNDLQQCADAIIRLRSEYFFGQGKFAEIDFADNNHKHYKLPAGSNRLAFDKYLEKVFASCGTLSLEKQLLQKKRLGDIEPGDVFIRGGSPGHAMLVAEVAVNDKGEKIYLLLQGYMPAQDVHIVVNPKEPTLSPWYRVSNNRLIKTPEFTFISSQLRSWPLH